jgi:BolA protein
MDDYIDFIENKIKKNIDVEKIIILDNSHKHKNHKSFHANKRHLYLEIESKFLRSLSQIDAQRNIMKILADELKSKIHALEIKIK